MSSGFLYIMSNPALHGYIKIGLSKKDPSKRRVKELSGTSVPEPFVCEYWAFVSDVYKSEKIVHDSLKKNRTNPRREFFDASIVTAIFAIRMNLKILEERIFYEPSKDDGVFIGVNDNNEDSDFWPKLTSNQFDYDYFIEKIRYYEKIYGNMWVQDGFKGSNNDSLGRLGSQIIKLRDLHELGLIPPDILDSLTKLNFIVCKKEAWEKGFSEYYFSVNEIGKNPNILKRYVSRGFNLSGWLRDQQKYFNKGFLSQEKTDKISALGYNFTKHAYLEKKLKLQKVPSNRWMSSYMLLEKYYHQNGHSTVPKIEMFDSKPLGRWVVRQRAGWKAGELDQGKIDLLKQLNFIWDINEYMYQEGLTKFKDYVNSGGDPSINQDYVTEDSFALGRWVMSRRAEKAETRGKISTDRVEELEKYGFVWKADK